MSKLISPHVPKFGDWHVNGGNGENHSFTAIFDTVRAARNMKKITTNDPSVTTTFLNSNSSLTSTSSTSTQPAAVHPPSATCVSSLVVSHKIKEQTCIPSSAHESIPPLRSQSKVPKNHKDVTAAKDWPKQNSRTTRYDDPKGKRRHNRSAKKTKKREVSSVYKPSMLEHWRLCFNSNHAVQE
ncbi:hypothetical protein L7F22_030219 [Adiantum nelumboides]|nr:hypothetical protein [Adiantum nelumboides]